MVWSKEHLMRLCVEQPKGTLPWGEKLITSCVYSHYRLHCKWEHMNVRCPCLLIAENATANFGLRLVAMYMSQVKRARSQPTQSPVPHESFPRQRDREEGSRKRRGTGRQHGEGERNQVTRAGRPEHSRGGRRQQRANKDEVVPLAWSEAGAARYRQSWLSSLPRRLNAEEAKRQPETATEASRSRSDEAEDESMPLCEDPKLAEFELAGLLGEVLRERRIALLQSSAAGLFFARHAFLLTVHLASSPVELYENSNQFLLVSPAPNSETSRICVQLGLDKHPDLPPMHLAVELEDCHLLTGKQSQLPAPLLLASGPLYLCMDLAEHTDAALGCAFSPRFHVVAGGYLQACMTHPAGTQDAALQGVLALQLHIDCHPEQGPYDDDSDRSSVRADFLSSPSTDHRVILG
eukprot:s866_g6.t1